MKVDFYFDFLSPYSYLAFCRRLELVAAGADLTLHPVSLGGIVKTLSITPPFMQPGALRQSNILNDLGRWARHYGVPLQMNPAFPMNTFNLLRGTFLAEAQGLLDPYCVRAFQACWVDGEDPSDVEVGRRVAADVGIGPDAWTAAITDRANKERLIQVTQQAIDRGIFGVPTFFVGEELFWGNDRFHFVLKMLETGSC